MDQFGNTIEKMDAPEHPDAVRKRIEEREPIRRRRLWRGISSVSDLFSFLFSLASGEATR